MSVQYTAIFHSCKNANFQMNKSDIFLIFAQNIDGWYTFESEVVLMSTHNLCFRAKIRKKKYTRVNPSFPIKKWGVRGCSLQGHVSMMSLFKGSLAILDHNFLRHYHYNCRKNHRTVLIKITRP